MRLTYSCRVVRHITQFKMEHCTQMSLIVLCTNGYRKNNFIEQLSVYRVAVRFMLDCVDGCSRGQLIALEEEMTKEAYNAFKNTYTEGL